MKRQFALTALGVLVLGGCAMDMEDEADPDLVTIIAALEIPLRSRVNFQPVSGSEAELDRRSSSHLVDVDATQLPSGHIVSLFYIVFNAPQNCTHPIPGLSQCSQPDSTNPATDASLEWADWDL